jgi:NADPH:quinone reductase-like Zn-dependent oxidoreductase
MKAIAMSDFDGPAFLQDLPDLSPGDEELLVGVKASSVNPVDAGIAAGMLKSMFDYEFPVVLGRDFAGTVRSVGLGVDGIAAGEDVFGFLLHANPTIHDGAWAERIIVPANGFIARKPDGVDFRDAGAAPLAALAAMAMAEALEITAEDSVLIIGASGGVGTFAVQLAKRAGAKVIAPGLAEDEDFLRSLGVDHLIERDGDIASALREIEPGGATALIDTVSITPEDLDANAAMVADGGRAASPNSAAGDGPGRHNAMSSADTAAVARLADLLADGSLRVPIQQTYPLATALDALHALSAEHTQGKLAIGI